MLIMFCLGNSSTTKLSAEFQMSVNTFFIFSLLLSSFSFLILNKFNSVLNVSNMKLVFLTTRIYIFSRGFKQDCPDGQLGKDKILEMYSMILPAGNAKVFVDQIFRIFDKDGNGSIDFKVKSTICKRLLTKTVGAKLINTLLLLLL